MVETFFMTKISFVIFLKCFVLFTPQFSIFCQTLSQEEAGNDSLPEEIVVSTKETTKTTQNTEASTSTTSEKNVNPVEATVRNIYLST